MDWEGHIVITQTLQSKYIKNVYAHKNKANLHLLKFFMTIIDRAGKHELTTSSESMRYGPAQLRFQAFPCRLCIFV